MCKIAQNSSEANGGHAELLSAGEPNEYVTQIKFISVIFQVLMVASIKIGCCAT
jgi:hypothetical protein